MRKFANNNAVLMSFLKRLFFFCLSISTTFIFFQVNVFATTVTFNCTGANQTFIVPTGVTELTVNAYGAGGGSAAIVGGAGGFSSGRFNVVPGDTYNVTVGCKGVLANSASSYNGGGFGGGGNARYDGGRSGAGGGGRSAFIKVGDLDSATNSIIAGGGGGGAWGSGGTYGTQAGGGAAGQSYSSYTSYGGAGGANGVGGIKGTYGSQTAGGAIVGGNGTYACGTGSCGSGGGGGGGYGGGGGGGGWNYDGYYTAVGGGGGGGKAGPNGVTTVGAGSAAATNGYITVTYTPDITPPSLSANNSSSSWYNSQRTATISASDDKSLSEVRYNFGSSSLLNESCTSGGTITTNSTVLNIPIGGGTLYLCARDASGNVSIWSGQYNWENTSPSAPSKPTITGTWVGDHYVNSGFSISIPSGSTDFGGSTLNSYSLYRCDDSGLTSNCSVISSGVSESTVTVSGSNLPIDGGIKYYYWTSIDNAGNSSNKSEAEYIRMDYSAPSLPTLDAEPEYTTGTSNTISSSVAIDTGIGGVEYNFCKNTTDLISPFTDCDNESNQSGWISTNSFEFTNLTPGQIYFYYVKVRDAFPNTSSWVGVVNSTQGNTIQAAPEPVIIPVLATDWNTDVTGTGQNGVVPIGVADALDPTIKIAELDVDFSSAPDWTGVTGGVEENKAFFHSEQSISTITNGAVASYSLFVKKGEGNRVWICPGASSINSVNLYCGGGYYLSEGQTFNGATASVEGDYWKISGLTGTGGMSIVSGLRDTLSRLQSVIGSDHTITFGTNNGLTANGHFLVLAFDPSGYDFDLSSLTITDIKLTDNVGNDRTIASSSGVNTWGVEIDSNLDTITFFAPTSGTGYYPAASQILIKIGTNAGGINQILNPTSTGSYEETIYILNTDIEGGTVQLPIIDSDQVIISGYVNAYINFDIDTNTDNSDCTIGGLSGCLTHSNGGTASNYTIDFGELTSAIVNKSLSNSNHSDGQDGLINSIYFDISTNAPSGLVVTVKSLNGGLKGPGTTNLISSIEDGSDIVANSGHFGFNLTSASTQKHGLIIPNILCDSEIEYCGPVVTPKTVFTTNNLPVDTARVRMDLAAAANYTNNPGLYTDTLTFIATATF